MAVTFDNSNSGSTEANTTLSVTLNIAAGANMAIVVHIVADGAETGITVSGAGASGWAAIPGANDGVGGHITMWGATAPSSGSQTVTASWTGAAELVMGVTTYIGVDQTTPFANGTYAATNTVNITAVNGDMTVDTVGVNGNVSGPTQTQTFIDMSANDYSEGSSRASATGTMTHTWTSGGFIAGVAVKQTGGGGAAGFMWL
jgi:hypothetical protein